MSLNNKTTYKLIVIIALLLLLVIFTLQNSEAVIIRFFVWDFQVSSALLIIISLLFGVLIGWLGIPFIQKRKKRNKEI